MKKRWVFLWPVFALPLFLVTYMSCNKTAPSGRAVPPDPDAALIREAISYFWSDYDPDTLSYTWPARNSQPLWNKAYVGSFSFGKGIVVPIVTHTRLSVSVGSRGLFLNAGEVTWLLMYKDNLGQWHIERITRLPDTPAPFTGKVRVEDWQGHFLRGFLYTPDRILALTTSRTYRRVTHRGEAVTEEAEEPPAEAPTPTGVANMGDPGGPSSAPSAPALVEPSPTAAPTPARPAPVTPSFIAPTAPKPAQTCTETDWYACSTIGDGPTQCDYAYTTEECTSSGHEPVSPPGSPTASDYTLVGLPDGGGASTSSAAVFQSIKPDTSITNHPIVECVYVHLMNPNLNHDLKSILASFDDNQVYNITFALSSNMEGDGMCTYLGNNSFLVNLNAAEATDSSYSRIYLASTFIHEAFHAKLRQKAIETFGEIAISQWPKAIDDMTLAELASYFEAESRSQNVWESVEHDWMVANISDLATSLEQFVQTYYKATYAAVGSDLAPYEAPMYMGLEGSTLYQEDVVGKGLEGTFTNYRGLLNEGGKCQN